MVALMADPAVIDFMWIHNNARFLFFEKKKIKSLVSESTPEEFYARQLHATREITAT